MAVPAQARCGLHTEVAAVDVCKRCGRFLCAECVELVGEDAYCAECKAKLPVAASRIVKVAFGASVAALPVALFAPLGLPLGVLLGLFALVSSIVRLAKAPADRRWAIAALVISALFFLLVAAVVAYSFSRSE